MRIVLSSVQGGSRRTLGEFEADVIRLGAGTGNDLVLTEDAGFRAEPNQAEICVESADRITLYPVGRSVPTRLNGKALAAGEGAPIRNGDRISFGDRPAELCFSVPVDPTPDDSAADGPPKTMRALITRALSTSKPARGIERTAVFVRNLYRDLQHSHRRLKFWFGAALTALLLVMGGVGFGVFALYREFALARAEGFKDSALLEVQRRYARSVVLVQTRYRFKDPASGSTKTGHAFGTGFYVDATGGIVTAKHVVQPWKFPDDGAEKAPFPELLEVRYFIHEPGGTFDPDSPTWGVETSVVELVASCPDVPLEKSSPYHASRSDADIALLRVPGIHSTPIFLPAEPDAAVPAPGAEPVVTLGFPRPTAFVGMDLALSVAPAPLRRVDQYLHLGGTIQGGISGAPVVNRRGELIAIAVSKIAGETGLGYAIRARHIRTLLQTAAEDR